MIYIKNACLCTPFEFIKDSCLIIEGKKIKRISPGHKFKRNPPFTEVIDAKGGGLVCPGFIDVHVQGAGGCDFLDGTGEAIAKISQTLAQFGTTSFLATTVFKKEANPHIENIVGVGFIRPCMSGLINQAPTGVVGARCLGIHLEGPFVNPMKKGMIRPNGIRSCSMSYFDRVIGATGGRLKMMTIAPELRGATEIVKKLRKKGIIASFGHSDANYEETQKGINAGIRHATHIFNAMRSMHHRDPGPLVALLTDDRVSVQLIADGIHIHPAVIKLIARLKGIKNIVLITDAMSSQGLPDGRYVYDGWEYYSKGGVCRYKDGTLIGTALPLVEMVKRMVKFGGVDLLEALQMATINPARVLGIDDKKGSIEEGKDADLVIMNRDLEVVATIIEGDVVFDEPR